MNTQVRTTVVFGLLSALFVGPIIWLLTAQWGWPTAFKLTLWTDLALYSLLLVRWSKTRLLPVLFPLGILLGAAVWPWSYTGFFLLALGVMSWIRSGVCFKASPLRLIIAETITIIGGAGMVAAWHPGSPLAWAIAFWLFFLVQALYFFILPNKATKTVADVSQDPFKTALQEAENILS